MEDVKEQHFEVDKRKKVIATRGTGKKEAQAGDLQGGPVVCRGGDVDRNCRASKRFAARGDARTARKRQR